MLGDPIVVAYCTLSHDCKTKRSQPQLLNNYGCIATYVHFGTVHRCWPPATLARPVAAGGTEVVEVALGIEVAEAAEAAGGSGLAWARRTWWAG